MNNLVRNGLVFVVIILFIGVGFVGADEPSDSEKELIKEKLDQWLYDHRYDLSEFGGFGYAIDIGINDMEFLGSHIWAVGNYQALGGYGHIFHSMNRGDNWTVQWKSSTYGPDPFRVIFLDEFEGFIGADDAVLHTTDGGMTWSSIWERSGLGGWIRDFEVIDQDNLWCRTSSRTEFYLYTIDGGKTWEVKYNGQHQPPNPPTLIYPGFDTEPGEVIDALPPTFRWNNVANSDYYVLYISIYPYGSGDLVFDSEEDYGPIYGTSFTLPNEILTDGEKYRWNMRAYNNVGWSEFSERLYFRTDTSPSEEETPVYYTAKVFATKEGLIGRKTANLHKVEEGDHFVALPSHKVLCNDDSTHGHDYEVRITYNGKSVVAPVWDTGPWNTKDDYWNPSTEREMFQDLERGMPEAQAAYNNGLPNGYNGGFDGNHWLRNATYQTYDIQFGDRVRPEHDTLNVRDPAGHHPPIGQVNHNDEGIVIDGPVRARNLDPDDGCEYEWWKIQWNNDLQGWSAAKRYVLNPAGIDLSEGVWKDLDMTDNAWVTVEFLWLSEQPSEGEEGTPGFELFLVVCAIALILFWKRKYLV